MTENFSDPIFLTNPADNLGSREAALASSVFFASFRSFRLKPVAAEKNEKVRKNQAEFSARSASSSQFLSCELSKDSDPEV